MFEKCETTYENKSTKWYFHEAQTHEIVYFQLWNLIEKKLIEKKLSMLFTAFNFVLYWGYYSVEFMAAMTGLVHIYIVSWL